MDIAEFCSDYVQMLKDNVNASRPRKVLAEQIVEALKDHDVDTTAGEQL